MIRRQIKHRRNRRQTDPSVVLTAPPFEFTFPDPSGGSPTTITLTFNFPGDSSAIPVQVNTNVAAGAFSGWTCSQGDILSAATIITGTVTLTISNPLSSGLTFTVPPSDPTVRTAQGGYCLPGEYVGT